MSAEQTCTVSITRTPGSQTSCAATGCTLRAEYAIAISEEGHEPERVAACGPHLIVGQVGFITDWVQS